MRSEIERLEAELRAEWKRETLEAYGVALRAAGDPRGELIAIDLLLETEQGREVREALHEEKKVLQELWLGGVKVKTELGFIVGLVDDAEEILAAFDLIGPWARHLELFGEREDVNALLAELVRAERPYLASLELRSFNRSTEAIVDASLASALPNATPRLREIQVRGHYVVDDLPHPNVDRLVVDGHNAIGALRGTAVMPSVTALDFALHPDYPIDHEPSPEILRAGLVERSAFPRLRVLDVSRNEPHPEPLEPNCLAGRTPFFDVLPRFPILPFVEELRIPSLRNATQLAWVQQLVAKFPHLRVEVPRMYSDVARSSERVRIGEPVVWLAGDAMRDYDALMFHLGDKWMRAALEHAYPTLEKTYAKMNAAAQIAWNELWRVTHSLIDSETEQEQVSTELLRTLFDTIEDSVYAWSDVKKALANVTESTVAIRRINGFEEPVAVYTPPTSRPSATSERILEHERVLQVSWDLERLAVYADDLQQLGDIRGELIAIDLQRLTDDRSDLEYRRDKLHDEIFGRDHTITSQLGFAKVDVSSWGDDGRMGKVFVGDVAKYVREVEVTGPTNLVERDLAILIAEPRPWLRSLHIEATGSVGETAIAASDLAVRLPNLEVIELRTDREQPMFDGFVHPNVKRMTISGAACFLRFGAPWPAVETLDFAFGPSQEAATWTPDRAITAERLPALRNLDLTRNEPVFDDYYSRQRRHQCYHDFYEALDVLDRAILERLVKLRIPSPREDAHVAVIQRALENAPRLESFEIARRYPDGPSVARLQHPTAKLVIPEPCTWPAADQTGQAAALAVEGVRVPIAQCISAMEEHYEAMTAPERRSWDQLWTLVRDGDSFAAPATLIYAAADVLKVRAPFTYDEWLEPLVDALQPLAIAERTITIERTVIDD